MIGCKQSKTKSVMIVTKKKKRDRTEILAKFDEQTRDFLTALRITIDLRQYYLGLPVTKDADRQCLVAAGRFYLAGKKPRAKMLDELKHSDPLFRAALSLSSILNRERKCVAQRFMEKRKDATISEPVNGNVDSGAENVNGNVDTAAA